MILVILLMILLIPYGCVDNAMTKYCIANATTVEIAKKCEDVKPFLSEGYDNE